MGGCLWKALLSLPLPFTSLIYYYTFSKVRESPLKGAVYAVRMHNESSCMCVYACVEADENHEWPWISGNLNVNVKSMFQINRGTPVAGFSALFWTRHALGLSEGEHTCCTIERCSTPTCTHAHRHTQQAGTHETHTCIHLQTQACTRNLAASVHTETMKNKHAQAHSHYACITHHTVKEHS